MARKAGRRGFGYIRTLPSGRYQASYLGPDGHRHTARKPDGRPLTFGTRQDADGWLTLRHSEILRGAWLPATVPAPAAAPLTLAAYSGTWMAGRELEQSTRVLYRATLRNQVLPALGGRALGDITPVMVREWHARMGTGPTQRAHAYSLLRTILNTAVADDLIASNPCRVRGAGQAKRQKRIRPASLAELEALTAAMPARYRLMVLLAAWCAMRFGELAELRRGDVDTTAAVVRIRRGIARGETGRVVKAPKSQAGKRDVAIPPHLMPAVTGHLRDHVPPGRDALVFPGVHGGPLAHSTVCRWYYPARESAGRPDLRFHDLRHTGAVLAAATGATLAELMARLGHSTVSAAMRYQHAAADRDKAIAAALSELATVTPISQARRKRGSA